MRMKVPTMKRKPQAFTILEVLIALTASLLLLLGLARTYKLLGDKITERQSELELSSTLRDVAVRLRDELQNATCRMVPPAQENASEGYLVYHEGPFSASTTLLGSNSNPVPTTASYFRDSRFGDIDDYLAFTTQATSDRPFIGFIPQGILAAHRASRSSSAAFEQFEFTRGQQVLTAPGAYNHSDATASVPFRSQFAEIAYWSAPRFVRDANSGVLAYDAGSGQPIYQDKNQDLLPDEIDLHRRVLLVRPDLNMTPIEMEAANLRLGFDTFPLPGSVTLQNTPTLPFLTRNSAGNLWIVPLSFLAAGAQDNQEFTPSQAANAPNDTTDRLNAPGDWWDVGDTANTSYVSPNWLAGVARMQQFMDLSISRVTDSWTASTVGRNDAMTGNEHYGMPSNVIQANSMSLLSRPENRFGFVRIPEPLVSGLSGSSMPQLALCPPHPYLMSRFSTPPTPPTGVSVTDHVPGPPWPATFPSQAHHALATAPPGAGPFLNQFGRFTMTTFLRPEFALADRVSDFGGGLLGAMETAAVVSRGGSDIVATDIVGFDVRAFDPSAPQYVWEGLDGVPGQPGDDDGNGSIPLNPTDPGGLLELGLVGSDDEATTVNSMRINEALVDNGSRTPTGGYDFTNPTLFGLVGRGSFVDLNYARLPGGPMRGLVQFDLGNGNQIAASTARLAEMDSPFSGLQLPLRQYPPLTGTVYVPAPQGWIDSGRFVLSRGTGSPIISSFYQPTYDTWTDGYSTDVFDQEGLVTAGVQSFTREPLDGLVPPNPAGGFLFQRVPQDNSNSPTVPTTTGVVGSSILELSYRRWTTVNPGIASNQGDFAGTTAGVVQTAATDTSPFNVAPPIDQPLRAIQISIRVNDFQAETIRQQTVIQEF